VPPGLKARRYERSGPDHNHESEEGGSEITSPSFSAAARGRTRREAAARGCARRSGRRGLRRSGCVFAHSQPATHAWRWTGRRYGTASCGIPPHRESRPVTHARCHSRTNSSSRWVARRFCHRPIVRPTHAAARIVHAECAGWGCSWFSCGSDSLDMPMRRDPAAIVIGDSRCSQARPGVANSLGRFLEEVASHLTCRVRICRYPCSRITTPSALRNGGGVNTIHPIVVNDGTATM